MRFNPFSLQLSFGILLCGSCLPGDLSAQIQFRNNADDVQAEITNVFLPAPREMRQRISFAERAIADQRYSDAVIALGEILMNNEAEDYFVEPEENSGTRTSLKAAARRMLGEMPKAGRESYEIQFGAEARKMLDEAIVAGDLQKLTIVSSRYFHTEAGYDASLLLGRYYLDRSQPFAAALCLKRLMNAPNALKRHEPELSILLATSWLHAGLTEDAKATLLALKQRAPRSVVKVGGEVKRLFVEDEAALPWLEEIAGRHLELQPRLHSQWLVFKGDAARNAHAGGGLPIASYRWRVPTVNDPKDEQLVAEVSREYRERRTPALPVVQPLAVNDLILMRTGERLMAVDFVTGKRVWEYPWFHSHYESGSQLPLGNGNSSPRKQNLEERLWEDAAYGQLSSDGERVFLLDDLPFTNSNSNIRRIGAGGIIRINNGMVQQNSNNQLVALNLKKEGKLEWIIGGTQSEDEPRLSGAFFLGPPLPLLGELYVLAEMGNEIRLIVLDAKTGRLAWQQQLANVDQMPLSVDQTRRLAGATPSYSDGVLICPTSAGAVVAVDVATRSLLWGYEYPRQGAAIQRGAFRVQRSGTPQVGKRWVDSAVTIAAGRVLLTPVESGDLHCLDLLTGELCFEKPLPRGDMLYLGCVWQNNAVLVGSKSIIAVRMDTGDTTWKEEIALNAAPSGRGFFTDGFFYQPTADSQVLKIDLDQGKIVQMVETPHPLGNLICYRDEVISQGVDWLETYFQKGGLRKRVDELLSQNPDNVWALARRAELLLQENEIAGALADLRKAIELEPRNEETRQLLIETMLSALKKDFAANQNLADEASQLVRGNPAEAEFLQLVALGLQEAGQPEKAFELYLQLAVLQVEARKEDQGELDPVSPDLSVRRDRFVQGRLALLLASANDEQKSRYQEQIKEMFQKAKAAEGFAALEQFVKYFGSQSAAEQAKVALAQRYFQAGQILKAEMLLTFVQAEGAAEAAGSATEVLARLYVKEDELSLAAEQYLLLNTRYANVPCSAGQTGTQLFQTAMNDGPLGKLLARGDVWPIGLVKEEAGGDKSIAFPHPRLPLLLGESVGPLVCGSLSLDQRRSALVVYDRYGHERHLTPLSIDRRSLYTMNNSLTRSRALGHLVVISLGYELAAVDSRPNAPKGMLWTKSLRPAEQEGNRTLPLQPKVVQHPWGETRYTASDTQQRLVGVTGPLTPGGICFQVDADLVCADPLTGEPFWIRSDFEPGCELFGNEDHLFVVRPGGAELSVLNMIDGEIIATRALPRQQVRWATLGRNLLAWEQTAEGLKLVLENGLTSAKLFEETFPNGTKGTLVGDDEVALLTPRGSLKIISLATGELRVNEELEAKSNITALYVIRSHDQYLVVANEPIVYQPNEPSIASAPGGMHSPLVSGRVYAVSREAGKLQWPAPAVVDRFGLPLDQPTDSPVLTFLRHTTNRQERSSNTRTSVLCLSKADGRAVFLKDDITVMTNVYEVEAFPEEDKVEIRLPGRTFSLLFTEEPRPPAPPAQLGQYLPESSAAEAIGSAVLRAFGENALPFPGQNPQQAERVVRALKPQVQPVPFPPQELKDLFDP